MNFKNSIFLVFLLVIFSCKKDKKEPDTSTNPIVCTTSLKELIVDGIKNTIQLDTSYQVGNMYYTQHQVNDSIGCGFYFSSNSYPKAGKYTITPVYIDVIPDSKKVYIELFLNGKSFQGQTGEVTIIGDGNGAIIELCKIKFKNSFSEEHQVSLKSNLL